MDLLRGYEDWMTGGLLLGVFILYPYPLISAMARCVCVLTMTMKLQMYDLRYPPTNTDPNSNAKGSKNYNRHTGTATATSTKPYLVFQDYSPVNITPEFDLSSELGIVANGASPPGLYSIVSLKEWMGSAVHLY